MPQREATSNREDQLDAEWRKSVRDGLDTLGRGQEDLSRKFSSMGEENAQQHGQLASRMEVLHAEVTEDIGVVKSDVARLAEQVKIAVENSTKKLEVKNKLIRTLIYALFLLGGVLAGVKAHALGLLKDFGL